MLRPRISYQTGDDLVSLLHVSGVRPKPREAVSLSIVEYNRSGPAEAETGEMPSGAAAVYTFVADPIRERRSAARRTRIRRWWRLAASGRDYEGEMMNE